jgi:hypothetical protein
MPYLINITAKIYRLAYAFGRGDSPGLTQLGGVNGLGFGVGFGAGATGAGRGEGTVLGCGGATAGPVIIIL